MKHVVCLTCKITFLSPHDYLQHVKEHFETDDKVKIKPKDLADLYKEEA